MSAASKSNVPPASWTVVRSRIHPSSSMRRSPRRASPRRRRPRRTSDRGRGSPCPAGRSSRSARRRGSGRGRAGGRTARPCRGDVRPPEPLLADDPRGELGARRALEVDVGGRPVADPCADLVAGVPPVCRTGEVATDSPKPRTARRVGSRVDDGRVAAVDELLDAERLDAELDRPAPVGRGVEEDVRDRASSGRRGREARAARAGTGRRPRGSRTRRERRQALPPAASQAK